MGSIIARIRAQITCDMRLALRGGGGWFHTLFFFAVFAGFAGFAIGPDPAALQASAPALVWLGAMISLQVSAGDLLRPDMEDGTHRVMIAECDSLGPYMVAKLLAVGVTTLVPMILLAPVFYLMFGLSPGQSLAGMAVLLVGAPALVLSSVVAAALSAGMRTGALLAAGLAAPLAIPVLIYGIGATEAVLSGAGFISPALLFLLAVTLFYGVILPPFAILSIRSGLE